MRRGIGILGAGEGERVSKEGGEGRGGTYVGVGGEEEG